MTNLLVQDPHKDIHQGLITVAFTTTNHAYWQPQAIRIGATTDEQDQNIARWCFEDSRDTSKDHQNQMVQFHQQLQYDTSAPMLAYVPAQGLGIEPEQEHMRSNTSQVFLSQTTYCYTNDFAAFPLSLEQQHYQRETPTGQNSHGEGMHGHPHAYDAHEHITSDDTHIIPIGDNQRSHRSTMPPQNNCHHLAYLPRLSHPRKLPSNHHYHDRFSESPLLPMARCSDHGNGTQATEEHGSSLVLGHPGMPEPASRPKGPKTKFSPRDDKLLIELKETTRLTWKQLSEFFPGRSSGTLQVRYCTKLKAKKKLWTRDMVERLRQAVDRYDQDHWHIVSGKLGVGFSPAACKNKIHELNGLPML